VGVQLGELGRIGIDWDEEPVRQSERHGLYEEAIAELRHQGLIYECFCTRAEIREAASAPHGDLPDGAYPGTCADLSPSQLSERRSSGRPPALRVRAGAARAGFTDLLCGEVEATVDDFVVRRNDGDFGYNLAVAVDDAEQGIGEVVRGADLLDSTPRQFWLFDRLGLDPPGRYAHVPLMLGPDGSRLAKRHGAVTLEQRTGDGESTDGRQTPSVGQSVPEVVGEMAASVGLVPAGTECLASDLVERFSWRSLRQ
jgi:glutamyl-tRNA synthetase